MHHVHGIDDQPADTCHNGRHAGAAGVSADLVAAWLAGIIVNLLLLGDFYDIALRDVGLLLGALALTRLAAPHTST